MLENLQITQIIKFLFLKNPNASLIPFFLICIMKRQELRKEVKSLVWWDFCFLTLHE